MAIDPRLHNAVQAELKAHLQVQVWWDAIAAIRLLQKDHVLRAMLGVTDDALALTFARVHVEQEKHEKIHFDRMAELSALAKEQTS